MPHNTGRKENENLIRSPTWKEYRGPVGVDMKTVHIPFENPSYTDPRRPCHDHNNHIIDWEANEIAEQESEIEFKRWFNESIHIRVNTILTKNIKKK